MKLNNPCKMPFSSECAITEECGLNQSSFVSEQYLFTSSRNLSRDMTLLFFQRIVQVFVIFWNEMTEVSRA